MYTLTNTFNDCVISRHRTLEAAVKARIAHRRATTKANGGGAWVTYRITAADGRDIDREIEAIEEQIYHDSAYFVRKP